MHDRPRSGLFDVLGRELSHSARVLLRTPAFSLIAFITLALGIGATTAIYTVLDSVALRPLPYRNADRLVSVLHPATVPGNGESKWGMSAAGYFYFRARNHTLDDLGGYTTGSAIVLGDQSSEEVREADVTASLFSTIGARAALGRLIGPADDQPNGPAVVVLGYDYWQRRFGGDRNVVGTMLQTSGGPLQIIGVAEPGLTVPTPGPFASTSDLASFGVDIWRPLQLNPAGPFYNSHQYSGIGRLKPGITAAAIQRDLSGLMRDFPTQFPQVYSTAFIRKFNFRVGVVPLRDAMLGPGLANALWLLFGAVVVVLFIACANVANLFIVRMESRRRESAIRTALGADRLHMAQHFLSESMLLTLSAAIAGIIIARIGLSAILVTAPTDIPRLTTVALNGWSVVLALSLGAFAGLVFGLIPLARTTVDVNTLREGGRGLTASSAQRAVRSGLVVGQVALALALVLLATAGLMLRSFANLRNVKPGLDPTGVLTLETILPSNEFPDGPSVTAFLRQFQQRLSALPGVQRVGASTSLPLQDYGSGCTAVGREGLVFGPDEKPPCVATPQVLPGFFKSLRIQVRGRTPTWSDVDPNGEASTVAVVTQALANDLWPGQDAIGKGISVGGTRGLHQYYRVIGVIPELRAQGLDRPPTEAVLTAETSRDQVWTIRTTRGDPTTLLPSIRQILAELNPRVPIVNPRTMSDVVARSTARASFIMTLLVIAGAMALLLSAVGIYGVISYLVTQRRSEIGVRMALGARLPQVVSLILGQSMRLAFAGVTIGLIGAVLGIRFVRSLLFDVSPTDPLVLGGTAASLVVIAAVASLAPTRRATKIDPVEAMRSS